MNLDLFFPTPVYWYDVPNADKLNKHLIKHIERWAKKDKGIQKTNRGGWHSSVEMHIKKEYEPLVKEISKMQKQVCVEEAYTAPTFLGNMWANINYQGCFNKDHLHPNSHWSGVYFIKTPKDCGTLTIEDPRAGYMMTMPKQPPRNRLPQRLLRHIDYIPVAGRLLMFPSFLTHSVGVNNSQEKVNKGWSISVSFNFIQS